MIKTYHLWAGRNPSVTISAVREADAIHATSKEIPCIFKVGLPVAGLLLLYLFIVTDGSALVIGVGVDPSRPRYVRSSGAPC